MKFTAVVLLITDLYGLTASLIRHYHIEKLKTWSDAQEYCKDHYDDLSTISSMTELQQLDPGSSGFGWIGLHKDYDDQSKWKWSIGESKGQEGGEEEEGGGEVFSFLEAFQSWSSETQKFDCVYVDTINNTIGTMDCSVSSTFFCMKYTREIVLVSQNNSWEQALDYCRNHHHDLVSLHSDEENAKAADMIQADQTAYVWTGLRFLAGQWFWVSKDDLDYQAWATGDQPQCPPRNLRCGALEKNKKIWTPRDCEEKLNFICSKE
ncbi:hypothetical protein NFI96_002336 [Prochilodus magdalenae]|nr:hypothetical protein NFI96_002336 [Prochilodus magdalenae]